VTRVAAVDCGTNSIRRLVADPADGGLRDVHGEMSIVRLGQGVDATGQFAPEAIERTKAALPTTLNCCAATMLRRCEWWRPRRPATPPTGTCSLR
jgi:exopolyphosphatase/guanosine-5'-triphosphate,3'-diphosphate pyrophosphatase